MERVGDDDDASKNTSGEKAARRKLDELALTNGYVRTNRTGSGQKGVGLGVGLEGGRARRAQ